MHSTSQKSCHRDSLQKSLASSMSSEEQLFLAVNRGDARTVKLLLKKGVSINEIHSSGRTILGLVADLGNVEILKILLEVARTSDQKNDVRSFEKNYSRGLVQAEHECEVTSSNKSVKSFHGLLGDSSPNPSEPAKDSLSSDDEIPEIEGKNQRNCRRFKSRAKSKLKEDSNQFLLDDSECNENNMGVPEIEMTRSEDKGDTNQGYFVVVHDEIPSKANIAQNESNFLSCEEDLNAPKTPDDMDNLQWDCELQNEEWDHKFDDSEETDSWVELYQWYADYLAKNLALQTPTQQSSSCKMDVNQLDVYRRSAVHYAAERGNLEVLQLLISAGCSVDIGDADDVTPLHIATARDHPNVVALLLSCGANINQKTIDGVAPLHIAAPRGFMDTAGILLANGANVNALDRGDRTPLLLAVSRGLHDMVKLLINHGAKVNVEDILGYTPLCQAVWQQEREIVSLLLAAGAKLTHSDRLLHCAIQLRCTDIAELLVSAGSIVNLRDDNGDTPLIIAARSGQLDMVNLLLQNGAMANYPNGLTGSSPLHEAVEFIRASNYIVFKEILVSLLSQCGTASLLNAVSASDYDTPLVRALVHDKDHAMITLIQYGADVNLLQEHTAVVSEKYLQKRPSRCVIAQLMIFAGLDLWKYTPYIKSDKKYADDSPAAWIASMKFNPMSLSSLCRLRFRLMFKENLHRAIHRSGLPLTLRKFVMLEDIVNLDEFMSTSRYDQTGIV